MKANRSFRRADEGLSNVIGAILIFAIFVSTLVLIRVEFVPIWDEEREEAHMDRLANELRVITSDHIRQVGNQTATGITDPVTLGRSGGFGFFRTPTPAGTMTFSQRAGGVGAESSLLSILVDQGNPLFGASEDWEQLFDDTVVDIGQVAHLRVRISDPVGANNGPAPLASATLSVTDGNGDFVARLVADSYPTAANDYLRIVVDNDLDDTNPPVYREEILYQRSSKPDWYFINALDDELQFEDLLNAATGPLTLTLEEDGMVADYTLTYSSQDGGGTVVIGSGGLPVPDYQTSLDGGVLSVRVDNQRFVPQTYHLEHGAIILEQGEGAVMLVKPQFHAALVGTQLGLSWTLPGLTGANQTVSGTQQASLVTAPAGGRIAIEGLLPHYNVTLATAFPEIWAAHFEQTLAGLGLSEASGHFALDSTAGSVTLRIFGLTPDVASEELDIFLAFRYARVTLDLRANA